MTLRPAEFAGSWYSSSGAKLESQLAEWKANLNLGEKLEGDIKAIIVPHAGYRYSGKVALHSYMTLVQQQRVKKMILIGPSHRVHLARPCQFSTFSEFETPLGPLKKARISDILESKSFSPLSQSIDLQEHSLEIQFPLIKYVFPDVEILPILISSLGALDDPAKELAKAVEEDGTVLVVSSDFCHWGDNYSFKPHLLGEKGETISARIGALDQRALECIGSQDPNVFRQYISITGNTICGREPILLAMETVRLLKNRGGSWRWLAYEQSTLIKDPSSTESSVSYVAGAYVAK